MGEVPYGFKALAERIAAQQRAFLGRKPHEPLPVREIAQHHGATVNYPEDESGLTPATLSALKAYPQCWSAITVRTNEGPVILNNPLHEDGRQNSNITHEIAHLILKHTPGALQTVLGCVMRDFDEAQESEASLLGEVLLVPRKALVWAARGGMDVQSTARWLGASEVLVRTRANRTGVKRQFQGSLVG
ncbi:ImmA/IrrE family metallo-endopeptidase [Actinomadura sp. 3N508]|uniref:ImmA/IrrE family metallo-endopeptidase n=1 Tax=Actinomadura sp. 3N508 TaxID=3375153 RepID=UPI0037BB6FB1